MESTLVKSVPVLSKITAPTCLILLKIALDLIKIPFCIAKLIVITTTEGIANPSAQGQLTTRIEMALSKGKHHSH